MKWNNLKISISVIIVAICVIVIGVQIYFSRRENKAIQLAQEYVSSKYKEKMNYLDVRFSWIDPSLYHVYFSPEQIPELVFEVLISNDLKTPTDMVNSYGDYFSADNYYLAYFELTMEKFFQLKIQDIYNSEAYIQVSVPNNALYSFSAPGNLNDKMSLSQMADAIDEYIFRIKTNTELREENKYYEAQKMLEIIFAIKNSGYKPEHIVFWYNEADSNSTSHISIKLRDLESIDTLEQIIDIID